MQAVNAEQMRNLDRTINDSKKITLEQVMDNVGAELSKLALAQVPEGRRPHVCVVCGKGNNAGDGFAAARYMSEAGAVVVVVCTSTDIALSPLARAMKKKCEGKVNFLSMSTDHAIVTKIISKADVVVDAVFGTGLKSAPEGYTRLAITEINKAKCKVISVDLPSGMDADTGAAPGECVKADITLTVALPKVGMYLYQVYENATAAAGNCGEIIVTDAGIPRELISNIRGGIEVIDEALVRRLLPRRRRDSHKGDFGKLYTVCGSVGMYGASYLSAKAAMRCGVGLCTVIAPDRIEPVLAIKLTEAMTSPVRSTVSGTISMETAAVIKQALESDGTAALIGCGLGQNADVRHVVAETIKNSKKPLIIDADGINAIGENISILQEKKAPVVLTPHPGEMARLTGKTVTEIQSDRIGAARKLADASKCVVVLKGAGTVIADPTGAVFVNSTGGPALAKGGSGDVLAGMIAGFAAQGIAPIGAAILGTYFHGLSADLLCKTMSEYGVLAEDVLNNIPAAMHTVM